MYLKLVVAVSFATLTILPLYRSADAADPFRMTGTWDVFVVSGVSEDLLMWPATFSEDGMSVLMQNMGELGCEETCIYAVSYSGCEEANDLTGCTLSLTAAGGSFGECLGVPLSYSSLDRFYSDDSSFALVYPASTAGDCEAQCGDGFTGGSEACDDANTAGGDGCSAVCELECFMVAERRVSLGVESTSDVSMSVLSERGKLTLQRMARMYGGTLASAPVLKLGIGSQVGDAAADAVVQGSRSSVNGTESGWVDPETSTTDLCPEPVFDCTVGNDITIDQYQSATLTPGSYGQLEVGAKASLDLLESGTYDFCRVRAQAGASINVEASGVTMRVSDRVLTRRGSSIMADAAKRPLLQSKGPIKLGVDSITVADIEAAENTVKLGRGAQLDGTACAKNFLTARATDLSCTLPLPPADCGSLTGQSEAVPVVEGDLPAGFFTIVDHQDGTGIFEIGSGGIGSFDITYSLREPGTDLALSCRNYIWGCEAENRLSIVSCNPYVLRLVSEFPLANPGGGTSTLLMDWTSGSATGFHN